MEPTLIETRISKTDTSSAVQRLWVHVFEGVVIEYHAVESHVSWAFGMVEIGIVMTCITYLYLKLTFPGLLG